MSDTPILHIDIHHEYLEDDSIPEDNRYMFLYSITFKNLSEHPIELNGYHWILTNSEGESQEIHQNSLSGECPKLHAHEELEFAKGIVLNTPLGTLHGYFKMIDHYNVDHKLIIPPFRLSTPLMIH